MVVVLLLPVPAMVPPVARMVMLARCGAAASLDSAWAWTWAAASSSAHSAVIQRAGVVCSRLHGDDPRGWRRRSGGERERVREARCREELGIGERPEKGDERSLLRGGQPETSWRAVGGPEARVEIGVRLHAGVEELDNLKG